ncbi:hypothetical protein IHQ71_24405 [Rhizobium sp. TH2]|uniref:hypothetical protein n=1 Tax=Rhizobium sp. TH2 TaxID=2775403 RepID=UPI00215879A4|nr:hypothetical protein [Rhizobium sp. TH2]UVC08258.1 hypothetical protein IHQ71_24405 [Rhizobium sp. TH2]
MKPSQAVFLDMSPYEADGGRLIGSDPRQVPLADIRLLGHKESPIKAIRAKCIDCSGDNVAEARKCVAVNCALWPFRMGSNPFHRSSTSSKLENLVISRETKWLEEVETGLDFIGEVSP